MQGDGSIFVANFVSTCSSEDIDLVMEIIEKNLRLRFSHRSIEQFESNMIKSRICWQLPPIILEIENGEIV